MIRALKNPQMKPREHVGEEEIVYSIVSLGTAIILEHFEKKGFQIDTLNLDLCPSSYLLCDGYQNSHF